MKYQSVTFEMKATEQSFLWYCFAYCASRFYIWNLWIKSLSVTIQMKATEQYFPVVLLIMLCKVALTFESVDKI